MLPERLQRACAICAVQREWFHGRHAQSRYHARQAFAPFAPMSATLHTTSPVCGLYHFSTKCSIHAMEHRDFRRRGFSLVELMVVVGILVILAAIFIPYLAKVRESEHRTPLRKTCRRSWQHCITMPTPTRTYTPASPTMPPIIRTGMWPIPAPIREIPLPAESGAA